MIRHDHRDPQGEAPAIEVPARRQDLLPSCNGQLGFFGPEGNEVGESTDLPVRKVASRDAELRAHRLEACATRRRIPSHWLGARPEQGRRAGATRDRLLLNRWHRHPACGAPQSRTANDSGNASPWPGGTGILPVANTGWKHVLSYVEGPVPPLRKRRHLRGHRSSPLTPDTCPDGSWAHRKPKSRPRLPGG